MLRNPSEDLTLCLAYVAGLLITRTFEFIHNVRSQKHRNILLQSKVRASLGSSICCSQFDPVTCHFALYTVKHLFRSFTDAGVYKVLGLYNLLLELLAVVVLLVGCNRLASELLDGFSYERNRVAVRLENATQVVNFFLKYILRRENSARPCQEAVDDTLLRRH